MSIDSLLQAIMGAPDSAQKGGVVEQTGLPAGLAQSAITLVMGKLLSGSQPALSPAAAEPAGEFTSGVGGAEAPSLNSLLERMRSQGTVDETTLQASGLPQELSAKAGIDLPQAIKAIQAILGLLTGKQAAAPAKRRKASSASGTKPTAKAKAKSAAKPKAAAKTKAKAKSTAKPKAAAKTKAKAKAKSTAKPKAAAKTKAKAKSTAKPKAAAKTTTKAKPKTTAKQKAKAAVKTSGWEVTG